MELLTGCVFFCAPRHPQRPEQWDFLPSVRQRPPLELPSEQHGACSLCPTPLRLSVLYLSSQRLSLLPGKMCHCRPSSGSCILSSLWRDLRISALPGDSVPGRAGRGLLDWSFETRLLRLPRTRCPARPGPRLQGCAGRRDGWTCASFRCCTPACRSTPRGPTPAGEWWDCSETLRLFWKRRFSLVYFWSVPGASKAAVLFLLSPDNSWESSVPQHGQQC